MSQPSSTPALTLWTIGHSIRPIEEFLQLLAAHQIAVLADVRRFPGSRRHPQFGVEALKASLAGAGIKYEHLPELGGRRRPQPDSPNTAWRNEAFRGYADYMETEPFRRGIERLRALATAKRTAIMCAEAPWWRCHRALIADCLKARGDRVLHIMSLTAADEHPYTSAARIIAGELSYANPG